MAVSRWSEGQIPGSGETRRGNEGSDERSGGHGRLPAATGQDDPADGRLHARVLEQCLV